MRDQGASTIGRVHGPISFEQRGPYGTDFGTGTTGARGRGAPVGGAPRAARETRARGGDQDDREGGAAQAPRLSPGSAGQAHQGARNRGSGAAARGLSRTRRDAVAADRK